MQVLDGHDKWDIDKEAPLSVQILQIDADDSDDFGDFFTQPSLVVGIGDASYSPEQPTAAAVRLEDKEHGRPSAPNMSGCTATPCTQHPHNAGIGESAEAFLAKRRRYSSAPLAPSSYDRSTGDVS